MHPPTEVLRVGAEHRVARHRHQHVIAGIDQRRRQDGQRRLAANRVHHFRLCIDALDAAHPLQVTGRRLFQHHAPIVRIAAVLRLARLSTELLHHCRARHLIGLSDAQVNDLRARMGRHGRAFGPFDPLKFIDRVRLAVLPAANPLRKKLLNV